VLSSSVVTNPRVPRLIRHSLNLESGLNDGLALAPVLALAAALKLGGGDFDWLRFVVQDVGLGLVFGLALGFAAAVAASVALAFATFGVPIPFAGYLVGIAEFGESHESAVVFAPWITVPGILFDRAFGLAGSAPWVFLGALGVAPLLRARRLAAAGLLVVAVGTLAGLSLYRLWEGGWAPPNRYTAELLPLWTPFVAAGLAAASALWLRAIVAALLAFSAIATIWLAAIPRLAYSGNENQLARYLGKFGGDIILQMPSFALDPLASAQLKAVVFAVALVLVAAVAARRATA
jgi:NhaP-type Na+/H+ or K+/H+ antiporter